MSRFQSSDKCDIKHSQHWFYFTYYKPKPTLRHIIRVKWLGVTQHLTHTRTPLASRIFSVLIISDLHYLPSIMIMRSAMARETR